MERKIRLYAALAGLLLLLALVLYSNRKSTFLPGQVTSIPDDLSAVDMMMITDPLNKIILDKNKNGWRMNGKYTASTESVDAFMHVLSQIEVISPASQELSERLIQKLHRHGTEIILLNQRNVLYRQLICYEDSFMPGLYMIDPRKKQAFQISIPGMPDEASIRLFNTKEENWKDKILFNLAPEEIASVEINYIENPAHSFRIVSPENRLPALYAGGYEVSPDSVNPEELMDYLSFFRRVPYVSECQAGGNADLAHEPFVIITLTDNRGNRIKLSAYRKKAGAVQQNDLNLYWAREENSDHALLVKYADTDMIFRKLYVFLKK